MRQAKARERFVLEDHNPMKFQVLGIVGCGAMGSGIAQVAVEKGYRVVIYDRSGEAMMDTRQAIGEALARQSLEEEALEERLSGLTLATSLEGFAGCDVVIESIVEDMAEKKKLLATLDALCPPGTVLASNTSALSITEMAQATERPTQVAGFHFHLPVTRIHLVDLIPGAQTSEETIRRLEALGKSLGKEVVVCKDTPGFIVNRLLVPYLLDAIRTLEEGLADRDAIDLSMHLAANHPMGPFLLADYIGLDTLQSVSRTLYEGIGEERMRPPKLLERMVAEGHYGIKSGRGFYNHAEPADEGDRRARLTLEIARLI